MYDGMKKAFGPRATKTAHVLKSAFGDVITDCAQQMERWAEHCQDLHSRGTLRPSQQS